MSRLLIDTNIVIDLLAKRPDFYVDAADLFSRADKKELTLAISSLTFANTNYILSKLKSAKEKDWKLFYGILTKALIILVIGVGIVYIGRNYLVQTAFGDGFEDAVPILSIFLMINIINFLVIINLQSSNF